MLITWDMIKSFGSESEHDNTKEIFTNPVPAMDVIRDKRLNNKTRVWAATVKDVLTKEQTCQWLSKVVERARIDAGVDDKQISKAVALGDNAYELRKHFQNKITPASGDAQVLYRICFYVFDHLDSSPEMYSIRCALKLAEDYKKGNQARFESILQDLLDTLDGSGSYEPAETEKETLRDIQSATQDAKSGSYEPRKSSGSKYRRTVTGYCGNTAEVDIHIFLEAYKANHFLGHAVKKLLMPGQRGDKTYEQDLQEAIDAINAVLQLRAVSK